MVFEAYDGLREPDGVSGDIVYDERRLSSEKLLPWRKLASPPPGRVRRKSGGDGDLLLLPCDERLRRAVEP